MMKRAETGGTWDAALRCAARAGPAALMAVGLLILLFAWLRPSYPATVTAGGR